jgi:hypothetical protein
MREDPPGDMGSPPGHGLEGKSRARCAEAAWGITVRQSRLGQTNGRNQVQANCPASARLEGAGHCE